MVVVQPNHGGLNPIPFTERELQNIEKHVPSKFLVKFGTGNVPATVKGVTTRLPHAHVVHFACHGKQDTNLPWESGLMLDGELYLTVKEIMKYPMPNASLAYLSACETGMGAENLPDEAMHIAASLLFAGFRGVVATMW
jgi:CHAT domain-containing protein